MPRLLFKRYSIHEDSGLQSGQRQHLFATRQNQSFAGPGATNQSINQHPAHGSASHHFISVIKEAAREIHEVVLKYRITPNLYACGQAAPQKLACRFGVKSLVVLHEISLKQPSDLICLSVAGCLRTALPRQCFLLQPAIDHPGDAAYILERRVRTF